MVNAGAIEVACLVAGDTVEQKRARVVAGLSAFAARDLHVDEAVLASEAETGDRNRALAYLMRGAGSLTLPVQQALDVYFAQYSVLEGQDVVVVLGVRDDDAAPGSCDLGGPGHPAGPLTATSPESADPGRLVARVTVGDPQGCGATTRSFAWSTSSSHPAQGATAARPGTSGRARS